MEVVVVRGHLGLRDHEMIEFLVHAEVKSGASEATTMDFRRTDFGLFRTLVKTIP